MLYPPMSELLQHIDSRYLLVNVVARRARQISIESEMYHEPLSKKPVTLATVSYTHLKKEKETNTSRYS